MDEEDTTISMPISVFQQEFLPMDDDCKQAFDTAFPQEKITMISQRFRDPRGWNTSEEVPSQDRERLLAQAWASIDRDEELGPFCPGHFLHLSRSEPEGGDPEKYKIDASFIADADRLDVKAHVSHWFLQRMAIHFRACGSELDPQDDDFKHEGEPDTDSRDQVRGQLMPYVAHAFTYQRRTAFFMLLVNGPQFRMMRWDRSGVIVTEAADYRHDSDHTRVLLELLFAFSRLSESGQGRDLTAVRLTPDSCGWKRMDELAAAHPDDLDADERDFPLDDPQIERFLNHHKHSSHSYLVEHCVIHGEPTQPYDCKKRRKQDPEQIKPTWTPIRNLFRETLSSQWPRFQITVGGRMFLVGKQSFKASGMVGRGTRGFPALDWESQEITFLKDTWRPHYASMRSEGEILQELNEAGIQGVATVVCHEDIRGQETVTSEYSPDTGSKEVLGENNTGRRQGHGLRHMIHHRVVLKELCLPSTAFSNAKELFTMLYHCISAHYNAYRRCRLIYRDISAGNMLLYPRLIKGRRKWMVVREGILSDWELAKRDSEQAFEPFRTGTWPYMSQFCLSNPDHRVQISDELESFVHVGLHHCVRFLSSNLVRPDGVYGFVNHYFDGYVNDQGRLAAPPYKTNSVHRGLPLNNMKAVEFSYEMNGKFVSHPVNDLFVTLLRPIKARYSLNRLDQKRVFAAASSEEVQTVSMVDEDYEDSRKRSFEESDDDSDGPSELSASDTEEVRTRSRKRLEKTAKKIKTHKWFIKTIESVIIPGKNWPQKDRIADQLQGHRACDTQTLTLQKGTRTSGTKVTTTHASVKRPRETPLTEVMAAAADVPKSKRLKNAPGNSTRK